MSLLRHHAIDVVLDVGANRGQYGRELRSSGYQGRIVSFEPLPEAFAALIASSGRDGRWTASPLALGDAAGVATLHIAGNEVSSSLLPMLDAHRAAAPGSAYVGDVSVPVERLDAIFDDHVVADEHPYLKIDAQGFERQVLDGAAGCLPKIVGVQVEMSLRRLYDAAATLTEIVGYLEARGFALMSIEPGFLDIGMGRQLQVDGIFFREPEAGEQVIPQA